MFAVNNDSQPIQLNVVKKSTKPKTNHKIYPLQNQSNDSLLVNSLHIDNILENEKQKNKIDTWNKLDKTIKMEKLQIFAEKYGKENGYQLKDIKSLVLFFMDCLEKKKLQKKKDLVYDKDTYEITSIPSLYFNTTNNSFTLKIVDAKRVSTLKSLTPIRGTEKNRMGNTL
jgi:hypothetical protein